MDFLTARDAGQSARGSSEGIRIVRAGGRFTFYPRVWAKLLWRRVVRPYDLVVDAENGIPVFAPLVVGRRTKVLLVVHHVHLDQFLTYFPWLLAQVGRVARGLGDAARLPSRAHHRGLGVHSRRDGDQLRLDPARRDRAATAPSSRSSQPAVAAPGASSLVVLGRLATHKRVDLVIRAVDALRATRPDITLDIVGSGPDEPMLHQLVEQLGLAGVVRFHGHVTEREKYALLAAGAAARLRLRHRGVGPGRHRGGLRGGTDARPGRPRPARVDPQRRDRLAGRRTRCGPAWSRGPVGDPHRARPRGSSRDEDQRAEIQSCLPEVVRAVHLVGDAPTAAADRRAGAGLLRARPPVSASVWRPDDEWNCEHSRCLEIPACGLHPRTASAVTVRRARRDGCCSWECPAHSADLEGGRNKTCAS